MPVQRKFKQILTSAIMGVIFLANTSNVYAQLVINEIMANDANEWIELFSTDITLSSADYWIDDDDSLVVNGSVQTGGDDPGSNPIQLSVDFQGTNFFIIELSSYLNNSGDHPTLFYTKIQ